MGWSSGTWVANDCLTVLKKNKVDLKPKLVRGLVQVFEQADCDNLCEIEEDWPEVGEALRHLHPEYYEDEGLEDDEPWPGKPDPTSVK